MGKRIELQRKLETFLGSTKVYFAPPESVKIQYPCFIYKLSSTADQARADDTIYRFTKKYQILYISNDAEEYVEVNNDGDTILEESPFIVDFLKQFRFSRFVNSYHKDNLTYYVFDIYF